MFPEKIALFMNELSADGDNKLCHQMFSNYFSVLQNDMDDMKSTIHKYNAHG
jgi:hypothetical protein